MSKKSAIPILQTIFVRKKSIFLSPSFPLNFLKKCLFRLKNLTKSIF